MALINSIARDASSGSFPNGFTWKKLNSGNQIEIRNSDTEVIYRGDLKMINENYETIHIVLTDYISNKNERVIFVRDMNILSEDFIRIEDDKIIFDTSLKGNRVELVEITPFYDSDYNTDLIVNPCLINTELFSINIEEVGLKDKDFVVWIGNNSCKINHKVV